MTDLSAYSDAELMAIAGGGSSSDLSNYSDAELMQIAGVQPEPEQGWGTSIYKFIAGQDVEPPSSIGEAFSNAAGNLTSSDWWLTRPSGEKLSLGQAVAGPALAINNAINPLGDETVAGGNSIIDYLTGNPTTYDQRLAQARGIEKSFDEAAPVMSGVLDVAGALKLPTKFGTKAEPLTAMGRIGQAVKEGAGYGAAFGFGTGEGTEARLQGGALGGSLGALLSGGVSTVAEGVRKAGSFIPGLTDLLTTTPEENAGQILNKAAGSEIKALANDSDNPLFKYRTLAEHLQSPELAQLEQSLGKENTQANNILNANLANRQKAQLETLQSLSKQPVLSEEAGGDVLRELIEPKADAAKQAVKDMFEAIDPDGLVPMKSIRHNFTQSAKKQYQAGGMPKELSGLVEEVNKKIQFGDVVGKPKMRTYEYVKSLRERAQDAWADLKTAGNAKGARLANQLVKDIDGSIEYAGKQGMMSAEDVALFKEAKKAGENYFDTYGMRGVGGVITKMKEGQYLSKATNVVPNTFDGTAAGTRKILRAIGDAPEELDKARGAVRDYLFRSAQDNDGNISAGKFRTLLRKYKSGINALLPDGKALFEESHLKKLDYLAEDLAFLDTQSAKSVKQLAYTASRGQPTTAQALMSKNVASKLMGNSISKLDDWFKLGRSEQVNAVLADAITNPQNAKFLTQRASGATLSAFAGIGDRLSGIGGAAPFFGRGSGSLASTLTEKSKPELEEKSPSFNSKLDSIVNQQIDKAMEVPKIITAKRVSSKLDMEEKPKDFDKLVKAVIKQESSGNAKAVGPVTRSGDRAQGLMQIMPATAKEIAKEMGIKDYDLHDYDTNKKMGEYYLKKMLSAFDGDVKLALAAYNWGIGNVKKAMKKYGDSWEDIQEKAPLETRGYVRNITKNILV